MKFAKASLALRGLEQVDAVQELQAKAEANDFVAKQEAPGHRMS